jgi:hypothetical protein
VQPQKKNCVFVNIFVAQERLSTSLEIFAVASERIVQLSGSIILDPDRILVDPESSFVASAKML